MSMQYTIYLYVCTYTYVHMYMHTYNIYLQTLVSCMYDEQCSGYVYQTYTYVISANIFYYVHIEIEMQTCRHRHLMYMHAHYNMLSCLCAWQRIRASSRLHYTIATYNNVYVAQPTTLHIYNTYTPRSCIGYVN